MAAYRYRAVTSGAVPETGTIDAVSMAEARSMLGARGLYVVRLSAVGSGGGWIGRMRGWMKGSRRLGAEELSGLCRQAATMVRSGVPMLTMMSVLARQAVSAGAGRDMAAVATSLAQGDSLAEALRRQWPRFPSLMISMVGAGEAGGMLDEVLDRLAKHYDREHDVNNKVRSALFYPLFVMGLSVAVVGFMITVVLPDYVVIFRDVGASLPLPTIILLWVGAMVTDYWLVGAGVMVFGVAVGVQLVKLPAVRLWVDGVLLRLPVAGQLWTRLELARFARTTGALLSGGVAIDDALLVVETTVYNRVLKRLVSQCLQAVRRGDLLSAPLRASPVVPAMVVEMAAVGEQSGALDTMLLRAAESYEGEIDRMVSRLATVIEPCLIVGLGLVVAFILVAIVMPMFDVFELIN